MPGEEDMIYLLEAHVSSFRLPLCDSDFEERELYFNFKKKS